MASRVTTPDGSTAYASLPGEARWSTSMGRGSMGCGTRGPSCTGRRPNEVQKTVPTSAATMTSSDQGGTRLRLLLHRRHHGRKTVTSRRGESPIPLIRQCILLLFGLLETDQRPTGDPMTAPSRESTLAMLAAINVHDKMICHREKVVAKGKPSQASANRDAICPAFVVNVMKLKLCSKGALLPQNVPNYRITRVQLGLV
mmetsp:Transcript_24908/g.40559  ORF Transcript_24908/g.40559 Transcript_24908/m.40559 type:complete len:200 (-) Transcript_24908:9-608(-)